MTVASSTGQAGLPTADSTRSFWHRDPSKILFGHRTTPSLPTKSDVVIVGSGISGASAAHFLRQDERSKNLDVVMLESREACWGATGRNGGHCQPFLYGKPPDIAAFEMRNYQTIKALVEEHNIPCEWQSVGGCHAYMNNAMFAEAVKEVNDFKKHDTGMADQVSIITKDSVNPSLSDLRVPSAAGAILQVNAASLWPYKLVSWILENLLASSGKFNLQTNTSVTHLQRTEDDSWIVHTERGMIATKKVLLTTNGYTSHLLPKFRDLIVPVQGEMSALVPPPSMSPASLTHQPLEKTYCFIGHGKQNINQDDYLVQRPFYSTSLAGTERGGQLMFGGGRSYAAKAGLGVSDDSAIDEQAAAYLRQELNVVLDLQNKDNELPATYEWSGIMGYSRDGRPWVGELSEDLGLGGGKGLWICAGFTGHGMPNTCLSAKAAVDMMIGGKAEYIDLPLSYRLDVGRVERARMLDEVQIADAKGTPLG
ncbi:FAD dependent oxidoreductase-like protein [Halenospora varia]|nr:FAD dependent oxidoreductase-like protein [Halenospora varia]